MNPVCSEAREGEGVTVGLWRSNALSGRGRDDTVERETDGERSPVVEPCEFTIPPAGRGLGLRGPSIGEEVEEETDSGEAEEDMLGEGLGWVNVNAWDGDGDIGERRDAGKETEFERGTVLRDMGVDGGV